MAGLFGYVSTLIVFRRKECFVEHFYILAYTGSS